MLLCLLVDRDAVVINVVSFLTSIYAGLAVFSVIGYMANEYDLPVPCVIKSGILRNSIKLPFEKYG